MTDRKNLILEFAQHYVWWIEKGGSTEDEVVAQVMNLGTYEDIRRLEQAFDVEELRGLMLRARPGWFSERSWDFWRGRLRFCGCDNIPEKPPRRLFHADLL